VILSLGSINADFQVRVDRRPEISETLVGGDFARFGGGKAANVAYLVKQLGGDVKLFGHVGDDDLAGQALAPLNGIGVDMSGVKRVPNTPTGTAMVTVPPDGKKGIIFAGNANRAWSQEDLASLCQEFANATPADVLVVDCEVPPQVVAAAVRAAKERDCTIILDPSPADQVTDQLLSEVDIVTPNASEAKQLVGIESVDIGSAVQAAKQLLERGVAVACIKMPDGGCVVVTASERFYVAPEPVEVQDTTGAGDAFAGAFATALAETRSYADAAKLAVAASTFAVTAYGSQTALAQPERIRDMAARLTVRSDVH
jgi:ribokinase